MKLRDYKNFRFRKSIRLAISLPASFQLAVHPSGQRLETSKIKGEIRDISADGVCVETSTLMLDGIHILSGTLADKRLLNLLVELPTEDVTLKMSVIPVWYDSAQDSIYTFVIGMAIVEMDEITTKTWLAFLARIREET